MWYVERVTTESSVPLVVGAGPVGLTMANELARHGVRCRIIDQAPERSRTSKALAIFPRTLEILETMGLADQFLRAGHRLHGLSIQRGSERLAGIEFSSVNSPFPFALSLPQAETERLLIEQLATRQIEVERGVSLTNLEQGNDTVRVSLRYPDGREETVETPWLLGCDGAHSTTRHALGLDFEGAQYDESFLLADVRLDGPLSPDRAHLFLGGDGLLGWFPFGADRWRMVASIAPETRVQALPEVTLEEVQTLSDRRAPGGLQLSDPVWMARFHISHRMVAQLRKLRVFLLGDAAHIHSPAGGQGMNTGIQDSFNLAWKLALVVKGAAPAQILASYDQERRPVAREVLNLTDRITRVATAQHSVVQSVRDFLLPVVGGLDLVGDKVAERMSGLRVRYRDSTLVENRGAGRPKAGDRAPDAELRTGENGARRIFELLREPRHVLLIFLGLTSESEAVLPSLSSALTSWPEDVLDRYRIVRGWSDRPAELRDLTGAAHAAYGLAKGGLVLIRPDGYIGYRSDDLDGAKLHTYLTRIFSSPSPA